MKKISTFFSGLILIVLLFEPQFINAQNRGQDNEPDAQKEKLLQLADQFHQEYLIKRAEVERVAQEKGWIIRQDTEEALWEIQYIDDYGMPQSYITCNLNAARTVNTDDLWTGGSSGLNLDGTGYLVGEWDGGGILTTHQEFDDGGGGSRVTQMDSPGSTHWHSTHVAGTLIADGHHVSGLAKGMAHEGLLNAYDWDDDITEMTTAASSGLTLSNHSYSWNRGWTYNSSVGQYFWYGNTSISTTEDYLFGFYDESAEDYDNIAYNAPHYLQIWAAANDRNDDWNSGHYVWSAGSWVWSTASRDPDGGTDGYDCIPQNGVAKNVLTVGAVNDITGGWTSPSSVVMSTFSSWGPTDDGRIKPDIVANGVNLYSTSDAGNSSYTYSDGTSMAAPSTTGTLALLQDYFQDLRGGTMLSSSIKGLVINTANEAGPANGPDYMFGWGLLNATGAADLITADELEGGLIVEGIILDGQNINYTYYCDGTSDIRVTLCWTDPPGTPPAAALNPTTIMLKHDLDLYIYDPGSTTHYPWRLNPSSPSSAATNTGFNVRDNVERIDIYSPAAGYYTFLIDEFSTLPAEGQAYSLIIQGLETEPSLNSYCDASSTYEYEYIKNVTMGSLDNTTGLSPGGYDNYTGMIETVAKGVSETLTVTLENAFSGDDVYAWIDWNQDGIFSTTESYELGSAAPYTTTFTVPTTAASGHTTMRVRMVYTYGKNPCGNSSYGETEDYTIYVGTRGLWTGLVNTDWNNSGNWDDNIIPTSTSDVTIPSGCPNYPSLPGSLGINTSSYTFDCNSLTINSGASLTVLGYPVYNYGVLNVDGTLNIGDDFFLNSGSIVNLSGTIQIGNVTGWFGQAYHNTGSTFNQTNGNYYVESIVLQNGSQYNGTGGYIRIYVHDYALNNNIQINDPDSYFYRFNVESGANAVLYNCTYDMEVTYSTNLFGPLTTNGFTLSSNYFDVYTGGDLIINTGGVVNIPGNGPYFHSGGSLSMISGSELNSGSNIQFISGSTENVTGGEIFVGGSFTDTDEIFSPTGGSVTFDGGSTSYIYGPTTFYSLFINKTGTDKSNVQTQNKVDIQIDDIKINADGPTSDDPLEIVMLSDDTKATIVYLNSNVAVTESLTIDAGELVINGHELTTGSAISVYGTLTMNNAADILNPGYWLTFWGGSTGNLFEGNVYSTTWVIPRLGCSFTASVNNTITFIGTTGGGPSNFEPTATYGNIIIDKNPANITYIDGAATEPVILNGNCTVNPSNNFYIQANTLVVHGVLTDNSSSTISAVSTDKSEGEGEFINNSTGTTSNGAKGGVVEIDNAFTLNGLLDVGDGDILLHGGFSIASTATLNIDGGTVIDDAPLGTEIWHYINGSLVMTSGLFEISNNSLNFGASSINTISGGTIRTGAFYANSAGTFLPTGGIVETIGASGENAIYCTNGNYFHDFVINRQPGYGAYLQTAIEIQNDLTINNGVLITNSNHINVGGNWTNNVGPSGFLPGTGTVTFNTSGDVSLISIGGGNFNNLTIDKPTVGDAVSLQDNINIVGTTIVNSGAIYSYDNEITTNGNVSINSGGFLYMMPNGILKLADATSLNIFSGGYFYALGSSGNLATITHNSSGDYGFNILAGGMIGAQYAVFEYMNGNGIYVQTDGLVHSVYTFNNCIFRNGHAAPSALLALNGSNVFTSTGAYFENTLGTTGYNVWKVPNTGNVEFIDASGDFQGEDFDYDPNNRVNWSYTSRTLDLTVFIEGPFNSSTNKMDLGINSILPLNQPFDNPPLSNPSPDWYYTGSESVGAIPNPFIVDWVLVQVRDASNVTTALPGTAIFTQAAFITNTGNIVDLDGVSPLTFTGSITNSLYAVVWTRNHLGVISANPLVEAGGLYTYDFSSGSGQAYGGTSAQHQLSTSPVMWGVIPGDANGTGVVAIGDKTNVWWFQAGIKGYLESDYNFDGDADNIDKNDYWLPNMGDASFIPE